MGSDDINTRQIGTDYDARYEEWRRFYEQRITAWMRRDELRAEIARLHDAGRAPSPELLLVHAMRELDQIWARGQEA